MKMPSLEIKFRWLIVACVLQCAIWAYGSYRANKLLFDSTRLALLTLSSRITALELRNRPALTPSECFRR
jgi:hypothetical protein